MPVLAGYVAVLILLAATTAAASLLRRHRARRRRRSRRVLRGRPLAGARRVVGAAAHLMRRPGTGHVQDHPAGGPFLHWVPDRDGGFRLAGEFVPDESPRRIAPARVGSRRGTRRRR